MGNECGNCRVLRCYGDHRSSASLHGRPSSLSVVMGIREEKLLDTYSLEELLEINDLTDEDVIELLIDNDMIKFIKPVDYND